MLEQKVVKTIKVDRTRHVASNINPLEELQRLKERADCGSSGHTGNIQASRDADARRVAAYVRYKEHLEQLGGL